VGRRQPNWMYKPHKALDWRKPTVSIALIPAALIAKEKWEDFVLFLRALPIDANDKKYLIIQWCQLVGVALTHDMVYAVLGELDERTRG